MIAELIAAIVGTFYISKYRMSENIRYFVFFLWFTFFVEIVGSFSIFISKYNTFNYLKGTLIADNSWLYNLHTVISYLFYINFFKWNIQNKSATKVLNLISVFFFIFSICHFVFTDIFFKLHSPIIIIIGTTFLLYSVFSYFYQLLQSDEILRIGKTLVFYIAIGTLVFHLCVTPFFIFLKFYKASINPEFVKITKVVIPCAIIFMYTCYTIGFIVCSRKNKSY